MRFLSRNRVQECRPITWFEELEPRIVLDASQDLMGHDVSSAPMSHGNDWALEYASNPAVSMESMLMVDDLASYPADLAMPVINWGPPALVVDGSGMVDMSGRLSVTCAATALEVTVTFNPTPLSSGGVASLSFTDGGQANTTWIPPDSATAVTNKWTFTGPTDNVNSILQSMQAQLITGFHGTAEIQVYARDTLGAATDTATKTITVNVPYAAGTTGDGTTSVYDQPSGGVFAFGTFTGPPPYTGQTFNWQAIAHDPAHPQLILADRDSNELDVGLRVKNGFLTVTPVGTVQLLYSNGIDQPMVQLRGSLSDLDTVLRTMTYEPYPGFNGEDKLWITAVDRSDGFGKRTGDPVNRMAEQVIPFQVVTA